MREFGLVGCIGGVGFKPNVAGQSGLAVLPLDATPLLVAVAMDVAVIGFGIRQIDSANAGFIQRLQFCPLADTIAVGIPPNAEILPAFVTGIQYPIAVAVVLFECFKAVPSLAAVGEQRIISEQFSAVVDLAVAVQIQSQQTIALIYPSSMFFKAIVVQIKPY